jgi:hypothetical protein
LKPEEKAMSNGQDIPAKVTTAPGTVLGFVHSEEESLLKKGLKVFARWKFLIGHNVPPQTIKSADKDVTLGTVTKIKGGGFKRSFTIKKVSMIGKIEVWAASGRKSAVETLDELGTKKGKTGVKLVLE